MLNLRVIQAQYGDSFILQYGAPGKPRYILIDGGPSGTFSKHLAIEVELIRLSGGTLERVVLSHIDSDHISGLLDLFEYTLEQKRSAPPQALAIGGLWINTFSQTLGKELADRLVEQSRALPMTSQDSRDVDLASRSIAQGDELTQLARSLKIPVNADFAPATLITPETAARPVCFGDLSIRVVGPGQKGLADLRKEWLAWLDKRKKDIEAAATPEEAAERARETDTSVPNLSSLMLYVREGGEGGPTLLLPGDGRGDHLLAGLEEAGLLKEGRIHVSLLKLPHHGSSRNLSAEFFERVTADRYLISADGRYDNPDAQALEWLAEAARKQDRAYTLIATNDCTPTKEFRQKFNRSQYRYTWVCLPKRQHALTVPLHN